MTSDTAYLDGGNTPPTDILYEFKGQLTKNELRQWVRWRLWRRVLLLYIGWLAFLGGLSGLSVLSDRGKSGGRDKSIGYLFIIFHVYFVAYFLYRFSLTVRQISKYEVVEGRETIVRFYSGKVEFVSPDGVTNQFRGTFARMHKTRFGLVIESPKGIPLALLPTRVLSSAQTEAIPKLYPAVPAA
jgi:hypothetical protein